jgi:hypothetical protein
MPVRKIIGNLMGIIPCGIDLYSKPSILLAFENDY